MRMYREALARAGDTDPQTITRWMRHTYPKELTDGASPQKNRSSWTIEKSFTGMRNEKSTSRRRTDRRQRALGIPTDWDVLEMHEIVFMEKVQASGQHYDWIPKDEDTFKSTNDFPGRNKESKSNSNRSKTNRNTANRRQHPQIGQKREQTGRNKRLVHRRPRRHHRLGQLADNSPTTTSTIRKRESNDCSSWTTAHRTYGNHPEQINKGANPASFGCYFKSSLDSLAPILPHPAGYRRGRTEPTVNRPRHTRHAGPNPAPATHRGPRTPRR